MSSWFDEVDKTPTESDEFFDDLGGVDEPAAAEKRGGSSFTRAQSGGIRTAVWLLPLIGVVVVTLGLSLWTLISRGDSETSAASSPTVEAAPVDPDSQVAVAGHCEPEEGETTLSTSDTSLRATVAKWQEAYYGRDTTLTQYLTADSWMRDQDWEKILPEAAPDGVSWCAVMAPVEGDRVNVDVMTTFSDGSSQTYQQTVIGKQEQSGSWLIDDIETR